MGEPLSPFKTGAPDSTKRFPKHFNSFEEFYPFYLHEHRNQMCKFLHFMGTCLLLATLVGVVMTWRWHQLWLVPVFGYGFAWVGHFGFEKNRPASFKWPLYSLQGDFTMFYHLLTGRLSFEEGAELK